MPYVETYIDPAECIKDLEDCELIEELEQRGFHVSEKEPVKVNTIEPAMKDVIWRYKNGYIEDAVLLLERIYPDLYGLSKRIKE